MWDSTSTTNSSLYDRQRILFSEETSNSNCDLSGQGELILVATGLEAVVVLATWSEPVKGLQAASCGLQQLWGPSSSSQQTDHSATALSWRVTTCTGQETPCRLWVTQWLLHLNGHYLSLDLFLLFPFHVDLNADMGGTSLSAWLNMKPTWSLSYLQTLILILILVSASQIIMCLKCYSDMPKLHFS